MAPWTSLTSAQPPIVSQPVAARSLRRLADGSYVADFGAIYAAVPTVRFEHGVAGRRIAMHAGYALDPDGSVSTTHLVQATDMSYSYVERAGPQTFRPFDYLGFRYLQIDASRRAADPSGRRGAGPPRRDARRARRHLRLVRSGARRGVGPGRAHSALFTAQEQFIDTPTREKGPFLRDGFNESEADMDAFGEQALTRRALLEFAASQARYWPDGRLNAIYPSGQGKRDIPDFTEIYPEWVWRYYLATGDRSLLTAVYPVLRRISDYLAARREPVDRADHEPARRGRRRLRARHRRLAAADALRLRHGDGGAHHGERAWRSTRSGRSPCSAPISGCPRRRPPAN